MPTVCQERQPILIVDDRNLNSEDLLEAVIRSATFTADSIAGGEVMSKINRGAIGRYGLNLMKSDWRPASGNRRVGTCRYVYRSPPQSCE
jgi:hypothetical protein